MRIFLLIAFLPLTLLAESRPNILVILADDLGFSDLGCYGAEIDTPNLDGLAAGGLRFTRFYNTARCWPTRSALLTGYYPQQIRMDPPKGRLPQWAHTLAQRLEPAGYRSYHSGKWHVQGAPRPVADGGFDRSFLVGDHDRFFHPQKLRVDDKPVPPVEKGSEYYVTSAMADHAIACLQEHATEHSDRPFFSYLAFTAPHFPLHALPEDIEKYRDKFLAGWDIVRERRWRNLRRMGIVDGELSAPEPTFTPRYLKEEWLEALGPGEVAHPIPWEELTEGQKRFQATKMAIHAAMVDRMDREIGRVLEQIRTMGERENTITFFLSDNGADASILVRGDGHDRGAPPGSAASYLCLGPGWSSAANAPFRRHKIWTHEGGISTPLIVHWPEGIAARDELRKDVGHVIDFVPTLLELAGIDPEIPEGAPELPGRSLVSAFAGDGGITRDELFFHHQGNRALRVGDDKIVSSREDEDRWELYDLSIDRGEQNDLADAQPERLRDMVRRWNELETRFREDAEAGGKKQTP